ncbi:CDP-diacylglycerol--serine O-phosphatidyltransferase [Roseovarius amoyensis]|uniref:CDP-diacylglycerol--serine O-phosphatidyltransferase n=1 Tax=Roseovarius amoyensis TaxID=2211448 RepID=UPI000DBE4A13|nr:CDP-diacylglycerol--serine O-phosphatidyltransferase [Roseovarius amoyensis]
MPDGSDKPGKSDVRLIYLLPNLLTISAICAGLTAIRFGYENDYEMAVHLVLAACVLDGLDGRLARLIKRPTAVGAELDSLADFLNFGVAPVLILHNWALQDMPNVGWIAVLIYAICCVLRLARFNVSSRLATEQTSSDFFVGVPSPAGAVLVLFPMVLSFAVSDLPLLPPTLVALHTCLIGLLMISRIPTYSFKRMTIDRAKAKYYLLGAVSLAAALLTFLWVTLTLLSAAYVLCLIWAYRSSQKSAKAEG